MVLEYALKANLKTLLITAASHLFNLVCRFPRR